MVPHGAPRPVLRLGEIHRVIRAAGIMPQLSGKAKRPLTFVGDPSRSIRRRADS